ncbi:MAG: response regulator, partial [candidate division Zixibacteria bacterium]|nr:response regulator [candidate division Zixibacteria bacterium]
MKVLIIDDEEMIRSLAVKILERADYDVVLAESGEEGIERLKEHGSDVVAAVIDFTLEGLTGVDTLR